MTSPSPDTIENVIIVGSGPAGYTAALYTSRANLQPLVIEGFLWGGLLQQTTDVENYPGFPEGIEGPELMQKFRDQAERFGTRFITDQATKVELSDEPGGVHKVWVGKDEYRARTVILAMGAEHKKLEVRGEEELSGRGVSYCATCDAAFFKEKPTMIVGGGDSAMEEAIFLSKFASKVVIVHRRDEFRASKIMLERARSIENIEWLTPYTVAEFHAGEKGGLEIARLRNTETDEEMRGRDRRRVHRDRPRAAVASRRGPGRHRRRGLRHHRGPLDAHAPARRLRRRRPRRPHVPPGRHGGGLGHAGRARRRVVPARHARGPGARGDARGRPRRGAVGAGPRGRLRPAGRAGGGADCADRWGVEYFVPAANDSTHRHCDWRRRGGRRASPRTIDAL